MFGKNEGVSDGATFRWRAKHNGGMDHSYWDCLTSDVKKLTD